MDVESLRREYTQRSEKYRRLKAEVLYILRQELKLQQEHIHQISGRVKPFKSFMDKARRQESDAPFETITDICGVRVICLFLSDLQRIGEIIESNFVIHSKDDKIRDMPEEAFGYFSVHYVGSLPPSYRGPRYDDLRELKFEIQLRTIAMHSWATISHYLDYKSPHAIPSHLRKDFHALSALFYIADSRFEDFHHASQEARGTAEEKAQHLPLIGKEEINLDTMTAYLRRKYPDRGYSDTKTISGIAEELRAAGYARIDQLDLALKRSARAFEEFERKAVERIKRGVPERATKITLPHFFDGAAVRISLSIADDKYLDARKARGSAAKLEHFEEYRRLLE